MSIGKEGYTVTVVANGREAVAACDERLFDVVLMDVQMPDMDGFEATGAIRQLDRTRGTRQIIIATTAHALKGDDETCLAAGMDAYISKPIDARHLHAMLAHLTQAGVPAA